MCVFNNVMVVKLSLCFFKHYTRENICAFFQWYVLVCKPVTNVVCNRCVSAVDDSSIDEWYKIGKNGF
jgi:hypothetical protein